MTMVQRVSRTDLARHTRRVLSDVQRGRTALIENHGEPEAALVDIVDYRILRAVMHYYAESPELPTGAGLSEEAVINAGDLDARYALVFSYYLAGNISLGRAAELLAIPWLELRTRCLRLDVPLRSAPQDVAEAVQDVTTATSW